MLDPAPSAVSPAFANAFAAWSLPVPLTVAVALLALIYLRGFFQIRRTRLALFTDLRLASLLAGAALLWIAIASPMDAFADALLSVHMVEHLLLMCAIPPLLLYSLPVVPLLRGTPLTLRRFILGPVLREQWLRSFARWLVKPRVAFLAMNLGYLIWHIPALYDVALENEALHAVEHLCFLVPSLLFWYTILWPWPARPQGRTWSAILYLLVSDVAMTILCAFLTFCDRPVYPYYTAHPNPFGISALNDQILGAVIMWVLGSFAFLVPAIAITFRLLSPQRTTRATITFR